MKRKFIFIWYQDIKHKTPSGQIAAIITLVIALIFLFMAITINIGKVSSVKTITQIAADGAALGIASQLSSLAYHYMDNYLGGKVKDCVFKGWDIIVLFVVGIFTNITFVILSVIMAILRQVQFYSNARALDRQFAKMPAEIGIQESAIGNALFATVDDPELIQDIHDFDEDTKTDDLIPRFQAWYSRRVLEIANKTETLEYYIDLILPHIRTMNDGLYECILYAVGDPEELSDPEGTEFKKWMEEVEGGINYKNVNITTDPPLLYNETIITDFPFWEGGEDNDRLDQFIGEAVAFHIWAWGAKVTDSETGKVEFYPGIINLPKNSLVNWFSTWYNKLLELDRQFNGWMKPIRCWIWNYWGCSDCSYLASDCEVGKVEIRNDKEKISIDDTLRRVLVEKIDELEEKIEKITDEETKKEIKNSINKLNEHISKIDTAVEAFSKARGGIFDLEVFLHGNPEADPPIPPMDPEIQRVLAQFSDLNKATYSWEDSLGWHHVRVEVSPFKIPKINWWSSFLSICGELLNYKGTVRVKVIRYDQDKDVNLTSGSLLWRFRIRSPTSEENFDPSDPEKALLRGISSSATVSYGPGIDDIKFLN